MMRKSVMAIGFMLIVPVVVQAESVIDAHIEAVGGAAVIAGLKTVHRTGKVSGQSSYGPLNGTVEEILDLAGDRGYTALTLTGYRREQGWIGDKGWVSDTQAGVSAMGAEELAFAKYTGPSMLAAIHAKLGAAALEVAGEREFRGQPCTVVGLKGAAVEVFVHQETSLLAGMSIPGSLTVAYENYMAVDGIQFATKVTTEIEAQQLTIVYDFTTTKVNGPVDAAKFKNPSAAPATETSDAPASQGVTAKQILGFLDKDGDGKIRLQEAAPELKPFFAAADVNEDGAIDLEEAQLIADFQNRLQGASKPTAAAAESARGRVTARQIVSGMDKNNDAKISREEASEDLKLYFDQFDTNEDGAIDVEEARAIAKYVNAETPAASQDKPAPGRVTAEQIINAMDKNDDGKISKSEASEQLKPYFAQFDTNQDGVIDAKEAEPIAKYANQQQ